MAKQKSTAALLLMILGVAMMAAGIYRGELMVLLNKATRICLECVGIG